MYVILTINKHLAGPQLVQSTTVCRLLFSVCQMASASTGTEWFQPWNKK